MTLSRKLQGGKLNSIFSPGPVGAVCNRTGHRSEITELIIGLTQLKTLMSRNSRSPPVIRRERRSAFPTIRWIA